MIVRRVQMSTMHTGTRGLAFLALLPALHAGVHGAVGRGSLRMSVADNGL